MIFASLSVLAQRVSQFEKSRGPWQILIKNVLSIELSSDQKKTHSIIGVGDFFIKRGFQQCYLVTVLELLKFQEICHLAGNSSL